MGVNTSQIGQVMSTASTSITTSYTAGYTSTANLSTNPYFFAGSLAGLAAFAQLTLSTVNTITLKFQGSFDNVNWSDLQCVDQTSGTTAVAQAYSSTGTYCIQTTANRYANYMRMMVKGSSTGGTGDLALVNIVGW